LASDGKTFGKETIKLSFYFNFSNQIKKYQMIPDWKNLHRLSERLVPLGKIGAQLRARLKPLDTIVL